MLSHYPPRNHVKALSSDNLTILLILLTRPIPIVHPRAARRSAFACAALSNIIKLSHLLKN